MIRFLPLTLAVGLTACQLPTIDVGTKTPIKIDPIDIKMRVDVYQHAGEEPTETEQAVEYDAAVQRQYNRMAEIQNLKNNRAIGENHRGLLTVREVPSGFEASYVKTVVEAENADRLFLMRRIANDREVLLSAVQEEQWQSRTRDANAEEWIEVRDTEKDAFSWKKKGQA